MDVRDLSALTLTGLGLVVVALVGNVVQTVRSLRSGRGVAPHSYLTVLVCLAVIVNVFVVGPLWVDVAKLAVSVLPLALVPVLGRGTPRPETTREG